MSKYQKYKASYQAYQKKNHKKLAAFAKQWRLKNLDKAKQSLEKSRKNHPERNLLNKARMNAKKKGLLFTLILQDIVIPEYCPYLDIKINPWGNRDNCPSLDRKDNSKGYTKDNIQVISFQANRMKNTASLNELITFADNILKRHKDVA